MKTLQAGDVKEIIIGISAAFTVAAALPAIVGTLGGAKDLRVSSWAIWTAAQLIGGFSSLAERQYPAAVYVFFCAAETGMVAVLSYRRGADRRLDRLDIACVMLAAVGLVLLVVVRVPGPAVVVSVVTDVIAYLPTIRHAWYEPGREPPLTYLLYGVGSGLVLTIADWHVLTAVAYPLYLVILDTAVAVLILASPHRVKGPSVPGTVKLTQARRRPFALPSRRQD